MNPEHSWLEKAKKDAALKAVVHVRDGQVVGLGSGSTAAYAIQGLGARVKNERLSVLGIPTSHQAFMLAVKNGIQVTTLEEHPVIDVTIDGADQISPTLDLIKGMGGALSREKIVASASKANIVVADETKKVKILGENDHPVPIEVLPFASSALMRKIEEIGGKAALREGQGKVGPVVTDNGNFIIDARFGLICEPKRLQQELKVLCGVLETGLFLGMVHLAYIGTRKHVEAIQT